MVQFRFSFSSVYNLSISYFSFLYVIFPISVFNYSYHTSFFPNYFGLNFHVQVQVQFQFQFRVPLSFVSVSVLLFLFHSSVLFSLSSLSFVSIPFRLEYLPKSCILVALPIMYKLLQKDNYCTHKLPQKNLPLSFSFSLVFLIFF